VTVQDLPLVNATLNGTSAVLLTLGYVFIRQKRIDAHRLCMIGAFVMSIAFLTTYLIYHAYAGSKKYAGPEALRMTYYAILLTHTVLAAAVPFLAVTSLVRGLRAQVERHRAIARWTLPIWWYVSVTGVLIYVMLYQL
jgi:uncharacterized membrane protein YozB (DUF420 family)